jgi:hypothetical protein
LALLCRRGPTALPFPRADERFDGGDFPPKLGEAGMSAQASKAD